MITLDEIVRGYIIQKELNVDQNYQRYYQIAVKGLSDLHYDVTGTPHYCKLTLDANGQADLPKDFLKLIRIGIINKYGELVSLGENHRLAYVDDTDDCGNEQRFPVQKRTTQSQVNGYGTFYGNQGVNAHGEITGGFFGTKGRVGIGEYTIDETKGKVVVSNTTSHGTLVLQYLANLSRIGSDYEVHEWLEEPLLNYIEWVSNRFKKTVHPSDKERMKREYYRTKQNLQLRRFTRNVDVYMQHARKMNSAIKF